jgi:hypothetical protein
MTFGYTTGVWPITFVDITVLTNGQIVLFLKGQGKGRLLIPFFNYFFNFL